MRCYCWCYSSQLLSCFSCHQVSCVTAKMMMREQIVQLGFCYYGNIHLIGREGMICWGGGGYVSIGSSWDVCWCICHFVCFVSTEDNGLWAYELKCFSIITTFSSPNYIINQNIFQSWHHLSICLIILPLLANPYISTQTLEPFVITRLTAHLTVACCLIWWFANTQIAWSHMTPNILTETRCQ